MDKSEHEPRDIRAEIMARLAKAPVLPEDGGVPSCQNPGEWLPQWVAEQQREFEEWHAQWRAAHPDEGEGTNAAKPPNAISRARRQNTNI
jgi:hypothetical protein